MAVTVTGLTKRYGQTLALDDVSLSIPDGQVHALLGHNGAGKSTLIKCFGGGVAPTSGTMSIDEVTATSFTPRGSSDAGVAVIYQHLSVIERLTVSENLFLGHEITHGGVVISRGEQRRLTKEALARVGGQSIDPDTLVGQLPIGQRQLVEIAKALQRNAKFLILDEPTAALSKAEAEMLGELVLDLKSQGISILYVTHLLSEVLKLADEVTVLRNGKNVWHSYRADLSKHALVDAISEGHGSENEPPAPPKSDEPLLKVEGFGSPGIGPLNFTVRPGEIVALHGLIGAGRSRLLNTMFGRHRADRGTIYVDGEPKIIRSPKDALSAGIALVPGDRVREGLFGSMSAMQNVVIRAMKSLAKVGFIRSSHQELNTFTEVSKWLDLKPLRHDLVAASFSGGNQQKILLARWVNREAHTKVLLLDDPTQGVDVGARKDIYDAIKTLAREQGVAVVVATNEPEEVIDLAHRCLLVRDGKITSEYVVSETNAEELLSAVHADAHTSLLSVQAVLSSEENSDA